MNTTRFDAVSGLFARRRAARQESTPAAEEPAYTKIPYLFVQSFQGGSLTSNEDAAGTYTLTLEAGIGQTVYFSDRPSRDVGAVSTPDFLRGMSFSEENPPNGAIVLASDDGSAEFAVVEMFSPSYDEATRTATYQVRGLAAWEDGVQSGLREEPADLSTVAASFGSAHLFIDDCKDEQVACVETGSGNRHFLENLYGFCYAYGQCMPCDPYGHDQPSACATFDYWKTVCAQPLHAYACPSGNCYPVWGAMDISSWLNCSH